MVGNAVYKQTACWVQENISLFWSYNSTLENLKDISFLKTTVISKKIY